MMCPCRKFWMTFWGSTSYSESIRLFTRFMTLIANLTFTKLQTGMTCKQAEKAFRSFFNIAYAVIVRTMFFFSNLLWLCRLDLFEYTSGFTRICFDQAIVHLDLVTYTIFKPRIYLSIKEHFDFGFICFKNSMHISPFSIKCDAL